MCSECDEDDAQVLRVRCDADEESLVEEAVVGLL